ncbi:MAG TPA: DAK2 domain-containing protein [Nitriliruptoraceae bacterium]|nr:DAK2 domain-containing protein [Nitriliruptoraceae bacterium]
MATPPVPDPGADQQRDPVEPVEPVDSDHRPGRAVTRETMPDVVATIEAALGQAREELDALNVFPVPDGDTGTNMVMTVRSALAEVDPEASAEERIDQLGHGAVRGARGNSGVIFSQVLRALLERTTDDPLDTADLADFLGAACDYAYDAVAEPLDGTILSALDEAVAAGERARADHLDLPRALEQVTDALALAVARTRDVLEENRLAGVVDAGARGLEVAMIGLRAHLQGSDVPSQPPPVRRATGRGPLPRESGSLVYQYEVQYLLEAPDDEAGPLRTELTELGDSVVVVACGGLLNVHVHTNEVDDAVAAGERRGTTQRVEVHAFADQIDQPTVEPQSVHRAVGHIVVLPSADLAAMVDTDGVKVVVAEPGNLPSVADLLRAAGEVHADEVLVLPGHRNVVPTAQQAARVSQAEEGPTLHVVGAATSVPASLAALAVRDDVDVDIELLDAAAADVVVGEVVGAVRPATTAVGDVEEGELLVIVRGDIVAASHDIDEVMEAVLDHLLDDGAELVTMFAGAGTTAAERQAFVAAVEARVPDADVELLEAGLPTSRWLIGAEGVPVHR